MSINDDILTRFDKPNLILAGPGTGKTTTLVNKIISLVNYLNANDMPNKGIIICTFTRKASEEIKLRLFSKITISQFSKINFLIGTIHSICYELLSRYSDVDFGDYQIMPEDTQVHFIYSKLNNLGFSSDIIKKNGWSLSEELAKVFNKITDEQIKIKELNFETDEVLEDYCRVYPTYKRLLKKYKLFDFATIQETLLNEVNSNKEYLLKLQSHFNYFFIDEYQDVNNIQDTIFKTLSAPNYNLTVVGDDDQSIYGFRGSNVEFIYHFEEYFSKKDIECKSYLLSNNYRSTKSIVALSNYIASRSNYDRRDKVIQAARNESGHLPVIKEFKSDKTEALYICDAIFRLIKSGKVKRYSDICVLFRSLKGHSQELIKLFDKFSIPYKTTGAGSMFESKLGLEFLALIDLYLARDIDKLIIFSDKIAEIDVLHSSNLTSFYTNNNLIDKLEELFSSTKFKSCIDLSYAIFRTTKFIDRYSDFGENIGTLTSLVLSFDDFSDFFNPWGLYSYLIYLRNTQKIDFIDSNIDDGVQLLTIHQSKGLEFPVIFLLSQNDRLKVRTLLDRLNNIVDSSSNIQLEEERRVFYVACTRAEDFLSISYSKSLMNTSKTYKSNEFLAELLSTDLYYDEVNYSILQKTNFRLKNINHSENISLSYNSIRLYNICPLAYKYANVWNLKTIRIGGLEFGRNIHKILEVILKKIKDGCNKDNLNLKDIFEDNWRDTNFRSVNENDKFKKSAFDQISRFISNQSELLRQDSIVSIEDQFNILIDNVLINGRFDAVFKKGNQYIIVDFKTGDKRDYSSQLSFYSLCFREKYNANSPLLAIYYLKSGELEYIKSNPIEYEITNINYVANSIRNNDFTPRTGKHCSDCAYNSICDFYKKSYNGF